MYILFLAFKKNFIKQYGCLPVSVKLKSGGSGLPFGNRVLPSRSSSKKLWAQACSGEMRDDGVYSSRRDTRSMASGGVRARKTCNHSHYCNISSGYPNTKYAVICKRKPLHNGFNTSLFAKYFLFRKSDPLSATYVYNK